MKQIHGAWIRNIILYFLIIFLVLYGVSYYVFSPKNLKGEVVSVVDGDTVKVLVGNKLYKVRLKGIDAPERSQPFGQQSKAALARIVYGKLVNVEWNKKGKYGRIIGKLSLGNLDVCREMIEEGMAWYYKKYESEQNYTDRIEYKHAESNARKGKRGLWVRQNPIPPWEWRRR